ncbi:hypothetical protein [Sphingobium sp.]|uniref:hypothetical protein n=1 Tax=Sphingobium sp. TaxID=1912891 RepID=UPI003BB6CB57
MIIAESMLKRWLGEAKDGDSLVYARATYLIPNVVTRRLFDLSQSGHVSLTRTRRQHGPGEENFLYQARRTALPIGGFVTPMRKSKPQDRRFSSHDAVVREIAPQVRAMLAEGAPRNACAIARALGIYSRNPVQAVLERMAA